jgi:hypothetical protein
MSMGVARRQEEHWRGRYECPIFIRERMTQSHLFKAVCQPARVEAILQLP